MLTHALLAAGFALVAHHTPQHGHGHGPLRAFHALNLSEAQRSSIHQILMARKAGIKAKAATAAQAQKVLVDAMASPTTDEAQLRTLYDAASAARFELVKEHRAILLEVQPLLTEGQKAKLAQMKEHLHKAAGHFMSMAFGD